MAPDKACNTSFHRYLILSTASSSWFTPSPQGVCGERIWKHRARFDLRLADGSVESGGSWHGLGLAFGRCQEFADAPYAPAVNESLTGTPTRHGHRIALDPLAGSASPTEQAVLARPPDAPVYHGFVVLEDVSVDGFTLGKISDFEEEEMNYGDAFVVAPDGSRAGLVWEVGNDVRIEQVLPPDGERWGVWAVWLPNQMRTRDDARANLGAIVPLLRPKWESSRPSGAKN